MKYRIKDYADIRRRVDGMEIDDLLRSVVCPDYAPGKNHPEGYEVTSFIHGTTEEVARNEIVAINRDREDKMLIVSDLEYGTGHMINGTVKFPSLRALSECGDEDLAYEMGLQTGRKARSVGYHWTFSPCVDILGNVRSPIVSIRSPGEDADTVLRFGGAYMRGMIDGGLYVTLKHFPGDGYSDHDQHLCTTENPLPFDEWDQSFGKVYRTLINDGAQAIMPGHISLPSYDDIDETTGMYPPATVSKKLMTELLRGKLGFEGIIVSDATNMSGFCGYTNLYRACALFLEGGGDCLLFVKATEEFLCEMKKQIEIGNLTVATLRDRAYRMMCFARSYFDQNTEAVGDDAALSACCQKITKGSVRVLRDKPGVLPVKVKKGCRIAHFVLYNNGVAEKPVAEQLSKELEARGACVETLLDVGPSAALNAVKSGAYDLLLCSIFNEVSYGLNTVKFSGKVARNMMNGWMRYGTPAVFVSYFDPYFAYDFESLTDTVINTYGVGDHTAAAVADLIFGEE